jgi:flagellar motor switch protein FliG
MSNLSAELRKAAILVASLDRDSANRLLGQMSDEQAARVRRAVVELDDLDPAEQRAVIDEFTRGYAKPSALPKPKHAPVELHLSSVSEPITTDDHDDTDLGLLHEASGARLRPLLENEHPQTIALVMSRLPRQRAGEMLATLAPSLQVDVIRRLVNLDQANPDVLREVERGLESRIREQLLDERRRNAGMATVADILAAAAPHTKRDILFNLSRHDRQLAGRFVERHWTFADLEHLPNDDLSTLLRQAEPQLALLALAGSTAGFVERVMGLLPQADARRLRESLDKLGPTRLSDVEEAQHELARLAEQLESEGQILATDLLLHAAA